MQANAAASATQCAFYNQLFAYKLAHQVYINHVFKYVEGSMLTMGNAAGTLDDDNCLELFIQVTAYNNFYAIDHVTSAIPLAVIVAP